MLLAGGRWSIGPDTGWRSGRAIAVRPKGPAGRSFIITPRSSVLCTSIANAGSSRLPRCKLVRGGPPIRTVDHKHLRLLDVSGSPVLSRTATAWMPPTVRFPEAQSLTQHACTSGRRVKWTLICRVRSAAWRPHGDHHHSVQLSGQKDEILCAHTLTLGTRHDRRLTNGLTPLCTANQSNYRPHFRIRSRNATTGAR